MRKTTMISLALAMTIVGCKKVTVDFTYEPAAPRAGQVVKFTNTSSAGEDWVWTFGDNTTSTSKHPNKVYKKPGKYLVTLMVDSAKYQTRSREIEVFDTVPTFVSSSDSILHYQDITFSANVYNPFKYDLTYEWLLSENCVILSNKTTNSSIKVYFKIPGTETVQLIVKLDNRVDTICKSFTIHESKAPAIVMRKTDKTVVRQRMINDRLEDVSAPTADDIHSLELFSDTMVTFNGVTFFASKMDDVIDGFKDLTINHMQIDAMAQKWYITTPDGLFVAHMGGNEIVTIDSLANGALHVDSQRNRLYWATAEGLWAMPLVKSKNNRFTTIPEKYNDQNNIDLITVNNTPQ